MPRQEFFKNFFNGSLLQEGKTYLEIITGFMQNEINAENIDDNADFYRTTFIKTGNISYSTEIRHSAFASVLCMLTHAQEKQPIERTAIENIMEALLEKKPYLFLDHLFLAMKSPIVLDIFLKKIPEETKNSLFKSAFLSFDGEIHNEFFLNTEGVKVLINNGLPVREFIESFEHIRVSDTVRKKSFSPLKDFTMPGDVDSKAYAEFYHSEIVRVRSEILRRMRLGMKFPSESNEPSRLGSIIFKKLGAFFGDVLSSFQKDFQYYSASRKALENEVFKKYFPESNERKQIFEEVSTLFLRNKTEGNRIIPINTLREASGAIDGHAEGLLVFNDLLMKINRGARNKNQPPGIVIFKKSQDAETVLSTLPTLSDDEWTDGDEFDEKIAKIIPSSAYFIISMKPQKGGNCPFATSKAFLLAIYFAVIRNHLQKNHPEENEHSINEKASYIAKSMYKQFSLEHRIQEIKKYIKTHSEDSFKFADNELLRKMILLAFISKNSELIEIIKSNKELYHLIEKEKETFLFSAIQYDDLDFILFMLSLTPEKPDTKLVSQLLKTAIEKNAVKFISTFNKLIGSLNDVSIDGETHPIDYSIRQILKLNTHSDTVIALLKQYKPVPYSKIAGHVEPVLNHLDIHSKYYYETRKNKVMISMQKIQEFCCNTLIEESKLQILSILENDRDPKQKEEELKTFHGVQKVILKELSVALSSAEEHERTFEAIFEAARVKAMEEGDTTSLTQYGQLSPEIFPQVLAAREGVSLRTLF